MTISLCMIVKNEEDVLARCLESIRGIADEIILTDTGSTDRTLSIARQFTEKIYHFDWCDDFSAARNFSFQHATMDYILWLDADDILQEKDRQAFLQLKTSLDPSVDLVMMPYHVSFDTQGNPAFLYERERLFKREKHYRWQGRIHECIPPSGNVLHSPVAITHRKEKPGDPDRNIRIFEKILASGETLSPREEFYYARELSAHGKDRDAAQWFTRFLEDGQGWVEDNLNACLELSHCRLRLHQRDEAILALTRSFLYACPRPALCCALGNIFFMEQDDPRAIYWYETALRCPLPPRESFCQPDYGDFIPYLQLCVCYERIGCREKARFYHEKAKRLKPEDPAVQNNERYFYP